MYTHVYIYIYICVYIWYCRRFFVILRFCVLFSPWGNPEVGGGVFRMKWVIEYSRLFMIAVLNRVSRVMLQTRLYNSGGCRCALVGVPWQGSVSARSAWGDMSVSTCCQKCWECRAFWDGRAHLWGHTYNCLNNAWVLGDHTSAASRRACVSTYIIA